MCACGKCGQARIQDPGCSATPPAESLRSLSNFHSTRCRHYVNLDCFESAVIPKGCTAAGMTHFGGMDNTKCKPRRIQTLSWVLERNPAGPT